MKYLERLILKENKRGIGLKYAINGLLVIIKEERNFRIHLCFALFAIIMSLFLRINNIEWLIVILTIHLVLLMELINSVIERIIDYIKPDIHPMAKKIKDIGAATVLFAAIMSIIIGTIIFLPKIVQLLNL